MEPNGPDESGSVGVWIARTYGRHRTSRGCHGSVLDPSHPRSRGMVHRSCVGSRRSAVRRIRRTVRDDPEDMDPLGFEPRASSLQRRHSTAELWAPPRSGGEASLDSSKVPDRRRNRTEGEPGLRPGLGSVEVIQPQIPLRLPCYDLSPLAKPRFDLVIQASSGPHSGALTGGVCKEQGRIHRALVTRDYYRIQLHVGEFQPTIRTTTRFLRLPSPFGVGTHCPDHCSPRVAQPIRGILTYRCPFLSPPWRRQSP